MDILIFNTENNAYFNACDTVILLEIVQKVIILSYKSISVHGIVLVYSQNLTLHTMCIIQISNIL